MRKQIVFLFIAIIAVFGCQNNNSANKAGTSDAKPSSEKIQELAKEAFVHCYPIFENYKGIYFYGVMKESPKYIPMNSIVNESKLYTPENRFVVSPNNDAYYSTGILDLRAEPVIIKVPESRNRYYVVQLVDMVTNNFAYIGVNTTGTQAGVYAVTGPDFKGLLPAGVKEIRSPSQFLIYAGRTGVNAENAADIQKARKLQKQYQVGVISQFYKDFKVSKTDSLEFPALNETDQANEQFFNRVNFLLQFTRLSSGDQSIIDKFKEIGIVPGKPYTFIQEHPEFKDAILNGINEGAKVVDSLSKNIGRQVNGWNLAPIKKEYFGDDYTLRTAYAKKAIYVNTPAEAYYPSTSIDANGMILNGKNNYSITFPAGKLPPAKYFWSITMYDNASQLLVPNDLKRYSIGDRTRGLKKNPDGSLTIYVGHAKPGAGTANWLPAPAAEFNLMMRIYGPGEEVLNETWAPPAVIKLNP